MAVVTLGDGDIDGKVAALVNGASMKEVPGVDSTSGAIIQYLPALVGAVRMRRRPGNLATVTAGRHSGLLASSLTQGNDRQIVMGIRTPDCGEADCRFDFRSAHQGADWAVLGLMLERDEDALALRVFFDTRLAGQPIGMLLAAQIAPDACWMESWTPVDTSLSGFEQFYRQQDNTHVDGTWQMDDGLPIGLLGILDNVQGLIRHLEGRRPAS